MSAEETRVDIIEIINNDEPVKDAIIEVDLQEEIKEEIKEEGIKPKAKAIKTKSQTKD